MLPELNEADVDESVDHVRSVFDVYGHGDHSGVAVTTGSVSFSIGSTPTRLGLAQRKRSSQLHNNDP